MAKPTRGEQEEGAQVIAAILRFEPDGRVDRLDEVHVETDEHVQLHDVSTLGHVLVLGDPDSTALRSELDRLVRTPAIGNG